MTLTEKLQNAIQSSELLKTIRGIKDSVIKMDAEFRGLTDAEISALEKNRNSSGNWSDILVDKDFSAEFVSGSRFHGKCRLGVFSGTRLEVQDGAILPSGIYDSVIADSYIGSESLISQCRLISNYFISENTVIYNAGSVTASKYCTFGNGLVIPAGPETGEIPMPLFAEMDMDTATQILGSADRPEAYSDYIAMYRNGAQLDRGFIGSGCVITDTLSIRDSFIGDAAVVRGTLETAGSTILSSTDEHTKIGAGVRISGSMIQHGCEIDSMAVIFNSLLMEHAEVENQCRISSSVVGPNSSLGGGEVTSTFAGPFTVSHHQSLLIAAIWPGGRGNIGYGANVGSNHTSRLPDQEIHPGEGMFFGLGCSIKFPADYRKAPYSIIATGTVTQAQRVEFPFSLITPPSSTHRNIPLHLNELYPGWVLRENIYAVLRNESKYRSRNKSKRNTFDFTILRPSIIDMMIIARDRLKKIPGTGSCFTERDLPGTGKNFITENSALDGIAVYSFYMKHYALTALLARIEEIIGNGNSPDAAAVMKQGGAGYWDHAIMVLRDESLAGNPLKVNMEALISSLEKIYSDAFDSRRKDYTRGVNTIEGYSKYHKSPEKDLSLADLRRSIDAKISKIREVVLKI